MVEETEIAYGCAVGQWREFGGEMSHQQWTEPSSGWNPDTPFPLLKKKQIGYMKKKPYHP